MAGVSMEELSKMKVADLKKELKDRGLPTTGTKDLLLGRLQEHLEKPAAEVESMNEENVTASDKQNVEGNTQAVEADAAPSDVKSKENIPKPTASVDKVESSDEQKKVVPLTGDLSDSDKLKARAAKFGGAVSESAKKLLRAERFGMAAPASAGSGKIAATPATTEDLEKMKKRADRFGAVVSNKLSKMDEEEKKRKRMERFGNMLSSPTEGKKVKLNSTDSATEEKKKKRAERFGLT